MSKVKDNAPQQPDTTPPVTVSMGIVPKGELRDELDRAYARLLEASAKADAAREASYRSRVLRVALASCLFMAFELGDSITALAMHTRPVLSIEVHMPQRPSWWPWWLPWNPGKMPGTSSPRVIPGTPG